MASSSQEGIEKRYEAASRYFDQSWEWNEANLTHTTASISSNDSMPQASKPEKDDEDDDQPRFTAAQKGKQKADPDYDIEHPLWSLARPYFMSPPPAPLNSSYRSPVVWDDSRHCTPKRSSRDASESHMETDRESRETLRARLPHLGDDCTEMHDPTNDSAKPTRGLAAKGLFDLLERNRGIGSGLARLTAINEEQEQAPPEMLMASNRTVGRMMAQLSLLNTKHQQAIRRLVRSLGLQQKMESLQNQEEARRLQIKADRARTSENFWSLLESLDRVEQPSNNVVDHEAGRSPAPHVSGEWTCEQIAGPSVYSQTPAEIRPKFPSSLEEMLALMRQRGRDRIKDSSARQAAPESSNGSGAIEFWWNAKEARKNRKKKRVNII